MFNIDLKYDDSQVRSVLDLINKKLIDLTPELKEISQYVSSKTQQHFNNQQGSKGKWIPSKLAIKEKRKTLTRTKALRRSLKFNVNTNKLGISFSSSVDYASTHQFGLKVNLFGKYPYKFPVRDFVWLDKKDEKLITDMITRGF